MPYTVVEAKGSKIRVVSTHQERKIAVDSMQRAGTGVFAVRCPNGRIVASNVARVF